MKKTRLLIVFSLIICCLLMLSSCEGLPELGVPQKLRVEQATLTLQWNEVADARLYTISIAKDGEEAKEFVASKNSYSLSKLAEGTYKIKVKANGKNEVSEDSKWSEEIPFTREAEPGMVFKLISGGKAYEITNKGSATGDIVIPDTYRGLPVTSIADKAFFNKSDVTGVVFGKNVSRIGAYAFANCSYLKKTDLPDGLVELGINAFASCRLLEGEITVPNGVEIIPQGAFSYCAKLTGVKFGSSVREIGKMAFTDCKELTSVSLPDSLISIGEYAFAKCEKLSDLKLGNKLEIIGPYAFSADTAIVSVTIPNSVTAISEGAFFECTALNDVTLGSGVRELGMGAFHSTKLWEKNPEENEVYVGRWFIGLKDITAIELSLRADTFGIASFALARNSSLFDVRLPDSVKLIGAGAFSASKINAVVIGAGVEEIGMQAFLGCDELVTVILGSFDEVDGKILDSSLKEIGNYAFQECISLKEIEMPSSLKTVGSYAFKETGLDDAARGGVVYAGNWAVGYLETLSTDVEITEGTVGIANYAFYEAKTLASVKLPSSIETVGRAAFYDCAALTSIELPATLSKIDDYTFYRCSSLALFELPIMLKTIGRSAFYKCGTNAIATDGDTENDVFIIPPNVESIGDFAFYGCGFEETVDLDKVARGIDVIMIGSGVKTIGKNAFYGFVSLRKLVLGESLGEIGERAFYRCENLAEIDFGISLKTIGARAFYKCNSLTDISLPSSVKVIGDYAFYKCEGLRRADLGAVESIGSFAFCGTLNMTKLVLPQTVKSIGKQAFRNCDALKSVILSGSIESMDMHAFYGCDNLTVYSDLTARSEGWHKHWNSSYRPVIWSATLSEEGDYVVSFEKSEASIKNKNDSNIISDPVREGYVFVGWGTTSSSTAADYSSETLEQADNGRKLFAIWQEASDSEE